MNPIGYIQFQREWLDRPWAKRDSEAVHVFLYLLCNAAFEPRPEIFAGKPITLQPGQLITGREKIAERTAVHSSKVQRILKKLEEFGEIEQQTSNVSRLISITCTASRTTIEQPANNQRTTNEQQMNNQRTLLKEVKNIRSKEGEKDAPEFPDFPENNKPETAIQPGTPEFDLLKTIGKPAAQMWAHGGIQQTFQTPAHADLALEWMQYCNERGKPFLSHTEIIRLVGLFNQHTLEDLRLLIGYSHDNKYPALYPDRLPKLKSSNPQILKSSKTHRPEIIQKDRFASDRHKAAANGLIKYD